jgi:hypothetical protein
MKRALVGISNNIASNLDKVKGWSESFKRFCPDADVVLICTNSSDDEIKACQDLGIRTIPVELAPELIGYINHKRLGFIGDFLKTTDHELIISTDVFDVVFQSDPFARMDLENYDIFASEEGVKVGEEPWNFNNIQFLFPNDLQICIEQMVVCSGIIAGKTKALIPVYEQMFDMCENHSTNDHAIKDQAAFIVMIAKNQIPRLKLFNLNDAWAIHCAVAGPTPFFHSWGFGNKLAEKNLSIPYMDVDNVVKTDGKVYDMVHQFNRVPDWNQILKAPYV